MYYLTDKEKLDIAAVAEKATLHIIDANNIVDIIKNNTQLPSLDIWSSCIVQDKRVYYTIERHNKKVYSHIAIETPTAMSLGEVDEILQTFGFRWREAYVPNGSSDILSKDFCRWVTKDEKGFRLHIAEIISTDNYLTGQVDSLN
jgi:hypothetical protein